MQKLKFYRCLECGNLIVMLNDSGVNPVCCGQKMSLLEAGTVDAAVEKHVPIISKDGHTFNIKVGSIAHPMTPEHYIEWIAITDGVNMQLRHLKPGEPAEAIFNLDAEQITAYAFCNLHGLWQSQS